MKKQFLTLGLALLSVAGFTQDKQSPISWGGYVKADYIMDTRNVSAARNGNYLQYPQPEVLDANGKDINSRVSFQGYAVEARLAATVKGPKFFGMDAKGYIEGDFFGVNNSETNGFHLRHAYVQLDSKNVEIKMGQYWHPSSVMEVFPGTYGFNAGNPYTAFNRSPQLRVTTKGTVKFIGAIIMEQDFQSAKSSARFSGFPAFHAQVQYKGDKLVLGAGVNVKTVDVTATGIETLGPIGDYKNLTSYGILGYAKYDFGKVSWKAYANYGGNQSELLLLGGWALDKNNKPIANKSIAAYTEVWGNISPSFEWGLFFGYDQDGGFNEEVKNLGSYKVFGVHDSWRVTPRFAWLSGKTRIGAELGYSSAQYGVFNAAEGNYVTKGIDRVDNFRVALSATYSF
ncbi:MAG: hypothetical protein KGV59_02765 [Tenacibaculum sp.]|nr:hypothetical protein [Tenacibaculum sp.]